MPHSSAPAPSGSRRRFRRRGPASRAIPGPVRTRLRSCILERERRAIAERLSRPYRRRGDRYRDLLLVTNLIRLEYEHLAGRVGGRAGAPSPPNGAPAGGDMPADWARSWGSGPMVEIGTAFSFYQDQADRLASRLPARTLASAAAGAAKPGPSGVGSSGPRVSGGSSSSTVGALPRIPGSGRRRGRPVAGSGRGPGRASGSPGGPLPSRPRSWPLGSARSSPRPAAVSLRSARPERRGRECARAPAGWASRRGNRIQPEAEVGGTAAHKSRAPQRGPGQGGRPGRADRVRRTASGARARSRSGARSGRCARSRARSPAPAPDPPAPEPQPDPKPRPGPVSSLPPPVDALPPPGGSGGGGG